MHAHVLDDRLDILICRPLWQHTHVTLKHAVPLAQYVISNAGIAEWDKLENVTAEGLIRHAPDRRAVWCRNIF